jgi:hypothetical protein
MLAFKKRDIRNLRAMDKKKVKSFGLEKPGLTLADMLIGGRRPRVVGRQSGLPEVQGGPPSCEWMTVFGDDPLRRCGDIRIGQLEGLDRGRAVTLRADPVCKSTVG